MPETILLVEKMNHDILVQNCGKDIGTIILKERGSVLKDNKGNDIRLEKDGEQYIVKNSGKKLGRFYYDSGVWKYQDNDGKIFSLEEYKDGFLFREAGGNSVSSFEASISIFPLEGINYDAYSQLDSNYY